MSIFREEALEHNSDTEYGDIVLPASFGMSVCAVATLLIFLSVSLFVYYGSYTRKAHLTGIVMPSSGLVKITPQYAGYVTRQTVSEGQHVAAGEPVYHISGEHYNGQGTGTLAAMSMSLKTQYAMLSSQQTLELRDNSQQQQAILQRIASWIGPYISIHFLSLNPLLVRRRRYSRGERYPSALCGCHSL